MRKSFCRKERKKKATGRKGRRRKRKKKEEEVLVCTSRSKNSARSLRNQQEKAVSGFR